MLNQALQALNPELDERRYVFVTLPIPRHDLDPVASIREAEGMTYIIDPDTATTLELGASFPCRRITLRVATALDLVGFMARVAAELAHAGIPCNPVAGFHHDHLFIPEAKAEAAMTVLREVVATAATTAESAV